MKHPGKWSVLATLETAAKAASAAGHLREPRTPKPEGRWSFASREADVYARFDGPPETPRKRRSPRRQSA
jgi:hypothetical protein